MPETASAGSFPGGSEEGSISFSSGPGAGRPCLASLLADSSPQSLLQLHGEPLPHGDPVIPCVWFILEFLTWPILFSMFGCSVAPSKCSFLHVALPSPSWSWRLAPRVSP